MTFPLEPGTEHMRRMGQSAVELVIRFVGGLEGARADSRGSGSCPRDALLAPPGEDGADFDELLGVFNAAAGHAVETAGPRFAAYVPGGGLYASALAEFVARSLNRFTGAPDIAPELVAMESGVLRWLCDEFRFPDRSAGVVTTGGSMATFSAVVAARFQRLGEDFSRGTIYVTQHTHHCIAKAALIAGFPARRIRKVPTTEDLRMDVAKASLMINQDRDAGLKPFFLVGTAGTTDTGTVDPIADLAALAARENLWFHVDGAYGGFFQLTERGQRVLSGIELADSVVLDPHKGLFLPYGTGTLLVRDSATLRAAYADHGADHAYLPDHGSDQELPDFGALGPELTREFRGLRLWLPLHFHGVGAFRAALDEKLDLAADAYQVLSQDDKLEVPWAPALSTVAFSLRGGSNDANERLLDKINATGEAFLSKTSIQGRTVLRLCILSHRTHSRHVDKMLEIIHSAVREQ
jgi:aromatic-L-amino-acid/L-tryptophan decarboxylase